MRAILLLAICIVTLTGPLAFAGRQGRFSFPSVAIDKCQERCSLETNEAGQSYVNCACDQGSRPRPVGEDLAIKISACRNLAEDEKGFANVNELRVRAARRSLPLCECAEARSHFPIRKMCSRRPTGEVGCAFQPDYARPNLLHAYRLPTAEDYQSCLAAAANYERPESCGAISRCEAQPLRCPAGEELSNEADPEACCPVFVCRKSKV